MNKLQALNLLSFLCVLNFMSLQTATSNTVTFKKGKNFPTNATNFQLQWVTSYDGGQGTTGYSYYNAMPLTFDKPIVTQKNGCYISCNIGDVIIAPLTPNGVYTLNFQQVQPTQESCMEPYIAQQITQLQKQIDNLQKQAKASPNYQNCINNQQPRQKLVATPA